MGLHPAMSKQKAKLECLDLDWKPVKEKKKSEYKPVILRLKTDPVPHPAHAKVLVYTYIHTYIHMHTQFYYLKKMETVSRIQIMVAWSARAVEYTDCTSDEG